MYNNFLHITYKITLEGWRSLMILHHVSNSNDNSYFDNYNETKIQYQTQLRTLLYTTFTNFR